MSVAQTTNNSHNRIARPPMFSFASHIKLMHGSAIHSRPKAVQPGSPPRRHCAIKKTEPAPTTANRNSGQNRARGRNRNGGDSDKDERNLDRARGESTRHPTAAQSAPFPCHYASSCSRQQGQPAAAEPDSGERKGRQHQRRNHPQTKPAGFSASQLGLHSGALARNIQRSPVRDRSWQNRAIRSW